MITQADTSIEHNETLGEFTIVDDPEQEPWQAVGLCSSSLAHRWFQRVGEVDNDVVRSTFEYEEAPSVALCIAILDLYASPERCGTVCLFLCHDLSARLAADPRSMDHYLVISSIRRLLFNAKVKFLASGMTSR